MANINFLENEVIEFKKTTGELKEGIISIVSILNKHQSGNGVRIDIWTHLMRECIINYVH